MFLSFLAPFLLPQELSLWIYLLQIQPQLEQLQILDLYLFQEAQFVLFSPFLGLRL